MREDLSPIGPAHQVLEILSVEDCEACDARDHGNLTCY